MAINRDAFRKTAEVLRAQLGRKPFLTISRRDVTDILREVSGDPKTRVKVLVAQSITQELNARGLTVYPALADSEGKDMVRVFRLDSVFTELIELLNYPGEDSDMRLRSALRKVNLQEKEAQSEGELAAAM